MNSDSCSIVRNDFSTTHPFAPAALSLTSTTETVFSFVNTTGPAIVSIPLQTAIVGSTTPNDPNANPAVLSNNLGRPGAGYRGSAPYFTSGSFDGRPFVVSAAFKGTVTSAAGGASVWTPSLRNGTSATIGSDPIIFAATGVSLPASHVGNFSGLIQATLIWDSVSGLLSGEAWSIVQGFDVTAAGALTAQYGTRAKFTSISIAAPSGLNFLGTMTIATTAPTSSSSTLTELTISQV